MSWRQTERSLFNLLEVYTSSWRNLYPRLTPNAFWATVVCIYLIAQIISAAIEAERQIVIVCSTIVSRTPRNDCTTTLSLPIIYIRYAPSHQATVVSIHQILFPQILDHY